jgi:Fe2+ transport system protein FeoA
MKRVGLRNKIMAQYWHNMSPDAIRRDLGCTQQTINKWLQPLRDIPLHALPKKLISLGWSPGELIRVLKIDEGELKNDYGVTFKARGIKTIADDQLVELIDNEHTPEEIAEITNQNINHVRTRLREIGWVKPKKW